MNLRLAEAIADYFKLPSAKLVVLASSATAAFQGILDMLSYRQMETIFVEITRYTWPGMLHSITMSRCYFRPISEPIHIFVDTHLGGARAAPEQRDKTSFYSALPANRPRPALVTDCCHSWMIPIDPDLRSFSLLSFYPTKLVPGVEGGAVVCSDEDDADELRQWLYCGTVPGKGAYWRPKTGAGPRPGRKANMTDVAAALNLEALELAPAYMEQINESWQRMAARARALGIPYRDQPVRPYLFQVEVDPLDFKELLETRQAAWNFAPAELLTLPCVPDMKDEEINQILERFAL